MSIPCQAGCSKNSVYEGVVCTRRGLKFYRNRAGTDIFQRGDVLGYCRDVFNVVWQKSMCK